MMKITIREVKNEKRVYAGVRKIGTVRKFCCGVDFRYNKRPDALFSILKVTVDSRDLLDCIKALLEIKIPKKRLHWNFSHETAASKERMKKYEKNLNEK